MLILLSPWITIWWHHHVFGYDTTVCVFYRFMNNRAAANCRYQPTSYEHAANCYTHAVRHTHTHTLPDSWLDSAHQHIVLFIIMSRNVSLGQTHQIRLDTSTAHSSCCHVWPDIGYFLYLHLPSITCVCVRVCSWWSCPRSWAWLCCTGSQMTGGRGSRPWCTDSASVLSSSSPPPSTSSPGRRATWGQRDGGMNGEREREGWLCGSMKGEGLRRWREGRMNIKTWRWRYKHWVMMGWNREKGINKNCVWGQIDKI